MKGTTGSKAGVGSLPGKAATLAGGVVEHRMSVVEAFATAFTYRIWAEPKYYGWTYFGHVGEGPNGVGAEAYARLRRLARHDYERCGCAQ